MKPEHLEIYGAYGEPYWVLRQLCASSATYTIKHKTTDKVFGFVGLTWQWNGVANIWFAMGEGVSDYRNSFVKLIRHGMHYMVKQWGLHRIHGFVKADYTEGIRWATAMGFTVHRQIIKAYGPDKSDYVMVERVF